MVDVERLVAAVAFRREFERNESEAQQREAVAELFLREDSAIKTVAG